MGSRFKGSEFTIEFRIKATLNGEPVNAYSILIRSPLSNQISCLCGLKVLKTQKAS